jgi:hypothetical protein
MADSKRNQSRTYPGLVWPIILITAGVLFLLSNLGLLDINFGQLLRLWPVLLILIGLDILFGRRSAWGSLLVALLALLVVAGVVLLLVLAPAALGPSTGIAVERIAEPLGDIERAELQVGFAAGDLEIAALDDATSLIEARLDLSTRHRPVWEIGRSGNRATMALAYREGVSIGTFPGGSGGDRWSLALSPDVIYSLDVKAGAGEATLDLRGLDIGNLNVVAGAGQTTITFPEQGNFGATVSGGVGHLVLEIPRDLAARITVQRSLSAVNIPPRFEQRGDVYETEGYGSSTHRIDVQLKVGVGLLTIREP